jgi:hypothetical protein
LLPSGDEEVLEGSESGLYRRRPVHCGGEILGCIMVLIISFIMFSLILKIEEK